MYVLYDGNDLNTTQETVDTKSKLPVITIYVRMMFLILCNVIFYVTCIINHKKLSDIFTCVDYINYNIHMFEHDGPVQKTIMSHRTWDFLFICFIIIIHLFGQLLRYLVSFYSSYFIFVYCVASVTSVLLELQFVMLLKNIHRLFYVLNIHLKHSKHGAFNDIIKKNIMFYDFKHSKTSISYPFIRAMLRLHFYLCDVCSSINEVYGIKILLIIGYDFLVITSILFKLTSNLLAFTTSTTSSSSSSSTMGNTSNHVLAVIKK
ncbi:hypothetical protein WDU94_008722 [Cyamophila willieti]